MRINQKEIEIILSLYPIAKTRHVELQEVLVKTQSAELKAEIMEKDDFYTKVIKTVDEWTNCLTQEELILIDYRYFRGYNYQIIANETNYSNHSSVLKIIKKIIKKNRKKFILILLMIGNRIQIVYQEQLLYN